MSTHLSRCDCYECRRRRERHFAWLIAFLFSAVVVAMAFTLQGCQHTVAPEAVHSSMPSFDRGELNSGILAAAPGGFHVTPHFRDRYNSLVDTYGAEFKPALQPDEGVSAAGPGRWFIDAEHMQKFLLMNIWKKSGRVPSRT